MDNFYGTIAYAGIVYLITTVSGILMLLAWRFFFRKLDHQGGLGVIYHVQRLILLLFLLPVIYSIVWLVQTRPTDGMTEGVFDLSTKKMRIVAAVFFLVWLVGFLDLTVRSIMVRNRLKRIRKESHPASEEFQALMEKCRKQVGLKRSVRLYQNCWVGSAFTCGVIHPYIVLPDDQNFPEENRIPSAAYEIMLLHELTHIRHWDSLWGHIGNLVRQIHWVNPLIWRLTKGDQEWQEAHCDSECVKMLGQEDFYCLTLAKIQIRQNKYADLLVNPVQMFHDTKNLTMERIERMQRYKKESKMKKSAVAAVLTGVLLVGSTSVFAATSGIAAVQEAVFWDTVKYKQEEYTPWENYLEEEEFREEDLIQADYTIESAEDTGIAMCASGTFDRWLGKKAVYKSSSFHADAGGSIFVAVSSSPEDAEISAGIIEPDGTWRGVSNTGNIEHSFSVKTSGTYRVYIRNDTDNHVRFVGSYHN